MAVVDLADPAVLADVGAQRKRAALADEVEQECARLRSRASYLERKIARMPIGNARRKARSELDRLRQLEPMLRHSLEHGHKLKFAAVGSRFEERALRLLNDLVTAGED